MSQTYQTPVGTDRLSTAIKTHVANSLEALRSLFSGASAPASTVPYMLWADTSSGLLKIRNGADSAWIVIGSLVGSSGTYIPATGFSVASMSATTAALKLGAAKHAGSVSRILIVCDTASTSSSGNEWQFAAHKRTNATPGTPVALFSATVGTFTALGGVGGGAETVAYKVMALTPDQNATVAADDILTLTATKVGTATTLVNVLAWAELT